jgi:hypothetical protein
MAPCIERAIAERARTQLGHITDPQLRDMEASTKVVCRLVSTGWLERVGWHTYRLAGVPKTFETEVMAACLDHGGVASHRTAARLHGLELPNGWKRAPIEVSGTRQRRRHGSPLALVHSSTNLTREDVVMVRSIPTTTIARTILGLAALVPEITEKDLRNVIDTATRDGKASDNWLWWLLEQRRCRGRNGVSVLEGILSDRAGRGKTESWLERAFLDLVAGAGMALPEVQRRVKHRGAFVARVDFFYAPRLVIEVSGYAKHSTVEQTEADAQRRIELGLAGYEVVEFTYRQIVERPAWVLSVLAAHLGAA